MTRPPLPIDAALAEVVDRLRQHRALVLVAPPGAGKTTRVPPALVDAGAARRLLVLQPRRVAARAAAARIAEERGWRIGEQVGYQVRFERRIGALTRIAVLTEGVLTRKLQDDPFLDGVDCVVLDEFHERSLHADLCLALLREVQRDARRDLLLLVMSATLEAEPVAAFLDCPVLEVPGRQHPVATHYLDRADDRPLPQRVGSLTRRALREAPDGGDVLVFLPGAGAIARTAAELRDVADVDVLPLHGGLPAAAQDRALRRGPRRRVILSTNVAETSVTIAGVTAVVDSGLARLPRCDPRTGLDQLEQTWISQASADQRRGRAGRLGPGLALRAWTRQRQVSLPAQTPPAIRRVDLARVALELHAWGTAPADFSWFEAPDAGAVERAELLLESLGAIAAAERTITPLGRDLLALPLHPRLGRMLLAARDHGHAAVGATLAALLAERDIALPAALAPRAASERSGESDMVERLDALHLAERLRCDQRALDREGCGISAGAARRVLRARDELLRTTGAREAAAERDAEELLARRLLLAGFPDRVVRRRAANDARGVMVGGRGVALARHSVLRSSPAPLFVAVVVDAAGRDARVHVASAVEREWLETRQELEVFFDATEQRVRASERLLYHDLCLEERPASAPPDPFRAAEVLADHARADLDAALGLADEELAGWLARLRFLGDAMPELGLPRHGRDELLRLLPALCCGRTSFAQLRRGLRDALAARLDPRQRQALARHAPEQLGVPSGRQLRLRYRADGPPILSAALQELFGLADTPTVAAGRVQVLLELLAPNRRPVQLTQDLASFWDVTYPEVRRQLRGRYPKHAWPEDPWKAEPTFRTARRRRRRR